MRIALCMIVKAGEEGLAVNAVESVFDSVDHIYIFLNYTDKKPAVPHYWNDNKMTILIDKWTNFGDARNKNFAMVPEDYDFIVWNDTDDVWENPEKLRQVALATPKTTDGIYMAYDYQHDEFGNVTVQHYVARMVRNNGSFKWSDKILHESLEPVRHVGKAINNEVRVIHKADNARRDQSLVRNIEMLEKELKGEGSSPDPRTLFYLGSAYIDSGQLDEAKELLESYIRLSGWAAERAQAWVHLGNIAEYENDDAEMRRCYMHALVENPKDPSSYVELGKVEMRNKTYQKAVEWLEMALEKQVDPMTTVHNSTETTYRAYMYLAEAFLSIGGAKLDDAHKYAQKALELRPNEFTREYFESIQKIIDHRTTVEGVMMVLKNLAEQDKKDELLRFIYALPEELKDNPAILRYQKRYAPAKVWPKKSIVIFTGNSILGEWGPWSLEEGIGGSEEAVIRLSRQLALQGWRVTVYATPGARVGHYRHDGTQVSSMAYTDTDERTFDTVEWRNYWELNLADKFDVFVAWRSPWFFDIDMTARKKYLWLHDVMNTNEFTKERLDRLDKVIVLSKYHRSLFPMIPDDKIFLSANGIDPEDFEIKPPKRDLHRIIYTSSHVRGLQLIYEVWPEIKKAVPKAKLDIYYGWGSYDAVNRDNPERMEWKQKMIDWEQRLDGVTDHGKIGQGQMVAELMKSGVWAYPCPFPEIFCIAALKAQAGGAVPVSSDFAALKETVNFGKKISMTQMNEKTPIGQWNKRELEEFKYALIYMLKNTDHQEGIRKKMMPATRKRWSWETVAKQWVGEFGDGGA